MSDAPEKPSEPADMQRLSRMVFDLCVGTPRDLSYPVSRVFSWVNSVSRGNPEQYLQGLTLWSLYVLCLPKPLYEALEHGPWPDLSDAQVCVILLDHIRRRARKWGSFDHEVDQAIRSYRNRLFEDSEAHVLQQIVTVRKRLKAIDLEKMEAAQSQAARQAADPSTGA